jgi:hypothetical protein
MSLVILALFLSGLWWLPWFVSVAWGIGLLVLQLFGQEQVEVHHQAKLQLYLNRALAYKNQINEAIKTTDNKHDRVRLSELRKQIDTWVEAIQELVERMATWQQNPLIQQDITEVPQAIHNLKTRLASETDVATQTQLQYALSNYTKQVTALEELQNTIERAEIQIESTLSLLGTIYSQILTSQSTHHVADYSRLSAEVSEQVNLLQDQLEALREVKLEQRW